MTSELPILILVLKAMTATVPVRYRKDVFERSIESYSASVSKADGINAETVSSLSGGAKPIIASLQTLINDGESFEEGENPPSTQAVAAVSDLLKAAEELEAKIPRADVSTWYGEIDITWKIEERLLRLMAFSDGRPALLYFVTDTGQTLERGETIRPATAEALADKLGWVLFSRG